MTIVEDRKHPKPDAPRLVVSRKPGLWGKIKVSLIFVLPLSRGRAGTLLLGRFKTLASAPVALVALVASVASRRLRRFPSAPVASVARREAVATEWGKARKRVRVGILRSGQWVESWPGGHWGGREDKCEVPVNPIR